MRDKSNRHAIAARGGTSETVCHCCGQIARPRMEHTVEFGNPLARGKLLELGIAPYDIVRVVEGEAEQFVLLAGDSPAVESSPAFSPYPSSTDEPGQPDGH